MAETWVATQQSAYADFFNKHYQSPAKNVALCEGKVNEFRAADMKNGKCTWPLWTTTNGTSFLTHYCDESQVPPKCLPYIYFTVNLLFGWIPQKMSGGDSKNMGNVLCELDPDEIKNEKLDKKKDFVGSTDDDCENNSNDFCGINLARFPYYGQQGMKSPIMRYKVTKMPDTKDEFVIRCRLDYPGYDKQMKSLNYPFSYRKDRTWTKIRISNANSCAANLPMLLLLTVMAIVKN